MLLLAALVGVAALSACSTPGASEESDGKPQVVVTTAFLADIVRPIAGEDADIVQLIPDGATPHSYSASAKDRATLEQADALVTIGAGYEAGVPLDDAGAQRINVAELVGQGEHGADEHVPDNAERGGPIDPHVWTDPTLMARAAPAIGELLARLDPDSAAGYKRRALAQVQRLSRLDRRIAATLATVPSGRRLLITSHDALGRFAERYGFKVLASPFGVSPEAQASAVKIAKVVDAARSSRVRAIFSAKGDNPAVIEQIAAEADVEVVDDLLVEGPGPGGRDYNSAMLHNARSIAQALR